MRWPEPDPHAAARTGGPGQHLPDDAVTAFMVEQLAGADLDGRSVCVLVPDTTRTCPVPLLLRAVHTALHGRVSRLTVLVALGTHQPLDEAQLAAHLGGPGVRTAADLAALYPGTAVRNHEWWDPAALTVAGTVPAARVAELSGGLLRQDVPVRVNRAVVEHDVVLVAGPVFPHEVVGFSGGNKYLFPGVSGPEVIDVSHWLGALISSAEIIGTLGTTPVRRLIDTAAATLPARRLALSVVVAPGGAVEFCAFGTAEESWAAAAAVAAETHVRYLEAPVQRVLSLVPARYDEMWTAAKGMYKVEPVVADGGEVVVHAPHVTAVSHTHGEHIARIGYHCRAYFTGQWDRFRSEPWGVLAHSTHLRGAGTWDPREGERCRIRVTLATGIGEAECHALGLGYLDPVGIDVEAWRAAPGTLVVPDAGEVLHRLRT
ncbi:lactate racemase domain-containing protein [Kineococcus sp. NUM-3379]